MKREAQSLASSLALEREQYASLRREREEAEEALGR